MMRSGSLFLALALVCALGFPEAAKADLKFCNKTDKKVWVAIGYKSKDEWVSEGWWAIDPGSCKTTYKDSLEARYYYYYAEDDADGRWSDDHYIFCTSDKEFTIDGADNCKSRGYDARGFREIDVGENISKTIDLVPQ